MSEQTKGALQKDIFLQKEGDAWYRRNALKRTMDDQDPVLEAVQQAGLRPRSVLEIGCADGLRLRRFQQTFDCQCAGIDPSREAIAAGNAHFPDVILKVGTADALPFADQQFDMLIFGFCLYLVDPDLYFRVVQEADRVLQPKGHVVIYDFYEPAPFYRKYAHHDGLKSHKMEFSRLFLAHPYYTLVFRKVLNTPPYPGTPDNRVSVDILSRDPEHAFPLSPYTHE